MGTSTPSRQPRQQQPTPKTGPQIVVKSIAERIQKPSPRFGHVAACIYARGGTGKTTLLGTMPGKGIVLDVPVIEGGTMVLHEHADRIDVFPCLDWSDLDGMWKYLKYEKHDYKWVAIDTITATQQLGKRKTVSERDLSADPAQITMQDWGKIGNLNTELFYRYRQLPLHLILLAQEKVKDSGEGGVLEYQPDISPASMTGLIPSMFLIGRLYTREVDDPKNPAKRIIERRLRVGPHASTVTKARTLPSRPLPPVIRDPNLGGLFRWILGAEDAKQPEGIFEDARTLELI